MTSLFCSRYFKTKLKMIRIPFSSQSLLLFLFKLCSKGLLVFVTTGELVLGPGSDKGLDAEAQSRTGLDTGVTSVSFSAVSKLLFPERVLDPDSDLIILLAD